MKRLEYSGDTENFELKERKCAFVFGMMKTSDGFRKDGINRTTITF
jgi:hypothetical protein